MWDVTLNRLILPATGLALFLATPVLADDIDQVAAAPSVADRTASTGLADIVVTAHRSAQSVDRVAASVTILTRAALETAQTVSVPELLSTTPGVSFTRSGGIGAVTAVNIRGAESHHTVALIDGVKVNDPSSTQGGFNFGNMLVGDVARIEVLRGAQSTLWGSQAIGGVINIVTVEPTSPLEGQISAEAGSFGTRYIRGSAGGASDRLSWRLAASRYDTDGYSAYASGSEKDGYTHNAVSGRMNLKITDQVSLDLRAAWSEGDADFDGFQTDSRESGPTDELVTYAGLNFDLLEGRFKNRIGYATTDIDRYTANPDRLVQSRTFEARGQNTRWDYQGSFAFTDTLSATFGVEREQAEMQSRSLPDALSTPDFVRGEANLDSVYSQFQWQPINGLNLTAGIRYDDHEQYGSHTLGQVSAAWALHDGNTVLRASWGQGFRAPGLYELYSEYGNLDLRPEEFDAWEVGVEHKLFGEGAVALTYFSRQADNEIRYNSCAFGSTDPQCSVNGATRWGYYANLQRTEAEGIEISGHYALTPALTVSGNYTRTDAKNISGERAGKRLALRPRDMGNLSADYVFASGFKASVSARFVGERFTSEANTDALDSYTLVDLRATYPVTKALEVYGRIENLSDEDYETSQGYGTAGRALYGGVRIKF